jgi:predicted membrane-bound spermidine synthase
VTSKKIPSQYASAVAPVLMSPLAGLEIPLAIMLVNMRRRNMAADGRRRNINACRGTQLGVRASAMDAKALG